MSLLREIQADAIDANVDISVVLRKCKILAARLGNEDFKLWVEHELNGYTSEEDVPEYRILHVESYGHFSGFRGSGVRNAPIPPSSIPEQFRDFIKISYMMQPISFYVSLIKKESSSSDVLKEPWPADLIASVGSNILRYMQLADAWKLIPGGAIPALLDTVRNRILSFVLEIEAEEPNAGEAPPNTKPIADERVGQVFNTYIQGNVANLSAGSQTITQTTEITVIQNDLNSLKQFLSSLEVGEDDILELDKAIQEDEKPEKETGFGQKVQAWLGKMINKAASGSWRIATSVAANLRNRRLNAPTFSRR